MSIQTRNLQFLTWFIESLQTVFANYSLSSTFEHYRLFEEGAHVSSVLTSLPGVRALFLMSSCSATHRVPTPDAAAVIPEDCCSRPHHHPHHPMSPSPATCQTLTVSAARWPGGRLRGQNRAPLLVSQVVSMGRTLTLARSLAHRPPVVRAVTVTAPSVCVHPECQGLPGDREGAWPSESWLPSPAGDQRLSGELGHPLPWAEGPVLQGWAALCPGRDT